MLGASLSPNPDTDARIEVMQGVERIVAMGQGNVKSAPFDGGLAGWHAGMHLPYVGWSNAIAPGCVVHSVGDAVQLHRERIEAGWVTGAELARGVSTVTTTFAEAPTTVAIILDDPAAFGDPVGSRQLLLGLDGAVRPRDAAGMERPPVLLVMENRSVLAYDIVPERNKPVVVTIASEMGWSLVGVMGSATLNAAGAIAFISARGLDAAVRPFSAAATDSASRLAWQGPTRSDTQRTQAKAMARGVWLAPEKPKHTKAASTRKPKRTRTRTSLSQGGTR